MFLRRYIGTGIYYISIIKIKGYSLLLNLFVKVKITVQNIIYLNIFDKDPIRGSDTNARASAVSSGP